MMTGTDDVANGRDLARFLNPTGDPFTMLLLQLAAVTVDNPARLKQLREAFPAEIVTWQIWSNLEEIPTADQLRALVGMVWWPGRNGIPATETIAFMIADYKKGKIALRVATEEAEQLLREPGCGR